jgi:two-component system chemotaxis response regulator CheB
MKTTSASRRRYDMVVMAASLGGLEALKEILSALPADFPVPIAIVQHRTTQVSNHLPAVLGKGSALPIQIARPSDRLQPAHVYLAPPDAHLNVRKNGTFELTDGHKIRHLKSSANPLFDSAAEVFGPHVLAVVLTGGDRDATDGVQSVKRHGGTVIAQDEATSRDFSMPRSAIDTGSVDLVLPIEDIGPTLKRMVMDLTVDSN